MDASLARPCGNGFKGSLDVVNVQHSYGLPLPIIPFSKVMRCYLLS
jgi:hypothetical protein